MSSLQSHTPLAYGVREVKTQIGESGKEQKEKREGASLRFEKVAIVLLRRCEKWGDCGETRWEEGKGVERGGERRGDSSSTRYLTRLI